jgi:hypothetical protein
MLSTLAYARSVASAALFALVACSSSNFDVASGGGDSGPGSDDTSQGGDSTGADTTVDDTGKPRDTSVVDVPGPDGPPDGIGTGDAVGGEVTTTCPVGTACSSPTGSVSCVDLATDPKNCGLCNKAVCHGEMCVSGNPTCVPGYGACAAAGTGCLGCKDFASDILNCGACDKRCVAGEYCNAGACKLVATFGGCASGTTRCGPDAGPAGCADLQNDRDNCGACGTTCAPDEYCAKGSCVQYKSAPGCSSCPCGSCGSKFGTCCTYGPDTICSEGSCPAG